jgi:RNA polymerase sigma factor (sigma-70 family)
MREPSGQHMHDWVQVQKFLSGDTRILEDFVQRYSPVLRRKLVQRGGKRVEADEIIASLWSDSVPEATTRGSLLEKYNGLASLQSWLLTVATRRMIDVKRSQRFTVSGEEPDQADHHAYRLLDRAPAEPEARPEDSLLELLQTSLRVAWDRSTADELIILHLVHLHGLTQREVGRMWGWTESKVSRILNRAIRHIKQETLRQVKQSDPWLELTWQDFLDLCKTRSIGFF